MEYVSGTAIIMSAIKTKLINEMLARESILEESKYLEEIERIKNKFVTKSQNQV